MVTSTPERTAPTAETAPAARHDRPFAMRANPPSIWPDFLVGQEVQPVRVLLVEADAHVRRVMAQELLADGRINLVAQAESLREGRRRLGQFDCDVLLVDLSLGDGCGYELVQELKLRQPMAEAIVVSAVEDEAHALRAFELGAVGYLVKNSWFDNLAQSVLQVVNGGAAISPSLVRRLLNRLDAKPNAASARNSKERLSGREKEVLKMVACGFTSGEIGDKLAISSQTVNAHVRNIYHKLQVHSRAQAVSCAANRGLL